MDIMWCISCESYERVHAWKERNTVPFHAKMINASILEPMEIDTCDGPFATVEPPVMSEEEWDATFANAPDPDEEIVMEYEENII